MMTHSLDEPKASGLTVRYQPDDEAVWENPPRFVWLPALDETLPYVLRVARSDHYLPTETKTFTDVRRNFFTPPEGFDVGSYVWSYAVWDGTTSAPASAWSLSRRFVVPEGLVALPLPSPMDRRGRSAQSRPRLWLGKDACERFATALASNPQHCGFDVFYAKSVAPFVDKPIASEPQPYPDDIKVAKLWRQIYIDCQEALYGVRHLAIAGTLTHDTDLIARAKAWLLAIAAWDPHGTSSRAYNDEAAFRVAAALAWGYDWLSDYLTPHERKTVRDVLLIRTRDMAHHVFDQARIQVFPYDSHAVRFLSAALIPCAIALLHDDDPDVDAEVQGWLDATVEYLFAIYTPWGGKDGGWAEGPHYWTLGMAYLLDAAGLLKSYLGIDLLQRPFFQCTLDFALYTKAPGTRRVSFGDDSTMGDLPSLKVGYNVRRLALATKNGWGQWYFEQLKRDDPGTARVFYNYGWWDFDFEDMMVAHDGVAIAARPPMDLPSVRVFGDVGWVGVQGAMDDPARQLQLVFKSSPYGSLSHSHGDQNAFLLRAFGEDLAIQSGHYVAFNSQMHQTWRRQTRSKNAILIGGKGQYAGKDKARAKAANGKLTGVHETADAVVITGDATAAYRSETPQAERVLRTLHLVRKSYLVIVDQVTLSAPLPLTWLLHAEAGLTASGQTFRLTRQRAGLYGQFILSRAGALDVEVVQGFPGVDPAEIAGLAEHAHIAATTPPAMAHTLVTLLVPYALTAPARVLHFIDDQGHGVSVSFVDETGHEFKIDLE
jgi:Domain of unknown function (DUF4962)/Heparinase II/III-like protein